MQYYLKLIKFFFAVFLCVYLNPLCGQYYSEQTGYKTVNNFHDDTLMRQHFWIEVDLLLNPIYISQFSSKYLLNGHRLAAAPSPRFYGTRPTQIPFSDLGETADQSNAIYANFRLSGLDKSKLNFLHRMRLMVGITHDKVETGSDAVYYKFPDGGTELTAMIDKNISQKLSDLDFKIMNLIFNFDVQAGLFASLANIYTHIAIPDTVITSVSDARWVWQNKSPYLGGWGWLTAANVEIGGVFCHSYFVSEKFTKNCWLGKGLFSVFRHIGFTVGARAMVEGLYTSPKVMVNGVPGYRLKVSNYGIFFAGPAINIKYLNF